MINIASLSVFGRWLRRLSLSGQVRVGNDAIRVKKLVCRSVETGQNRFQNGIDSGFGIDSAACAGGILAITFSFLSVFYDPHIKTTIFKLSTKPYYFEDPNSDFYRGQKTNFVAGRLLVFEKFSNRNLYLIRAL